MRNVIVILALMGLAACGVDGAPIAPEPEDGARTPIVVIGGDARIGVVGSL